jgi:hypothetical protein
MGFICIQTFIVDLGGIMDKKVTWKELKAKGKSLSTKNRFKYFILVYLKVVLLGFISIVMVGKGMFYVLTCYILKTPVGSVDSLVKYTVTSIIVSFGFAMVTFYLLLRIFCSPEQELKTIEKIEKKLADDSNFC